MAAKRVSAFDQALIEAQKPTPVTKQPSIVPNPEPLDQTLSIESSNTISPVKEPVTTAAARAVGRPKGVSKIKKTFYLSTGANNLRESQIELVKQAGLFLRDESEVADLALAVLRSMLNEKTDLARVLAVRHTLNSKGE